MDLQARIAAALTDFDDLLRHGVSIDAALEVAAVENGVAIEALRARASRTLTLEERQRRALENVDLERDVAARKNAEAIGSLFEAAYEAEKRLRVIAQAAISEKTGERSEEPKPTQIERTTPARAEQPQKCGKPGQLKFNF